MSRLSDFFSNPFSFLFTRSSEEDRLAAYVIREHGRGRGLDDILDDPYVRTGHIRRRSRACSIGPR